MKEKRTFEGKNQTYIPARLIFTHETNLNIHHFPHEK